MAPATLYTRTGAPASSPSSAENSVGMDSDVDSGRTNILSPHRPLPTVALKKQQLQQQLRNPFPPPSFLQRAYLKGILYKPQDVVFLVRILVMAVWALIRLHSVELPFLILSRFKYSSLQHPLGWRWGWSIVMSLVRSTGTQFRTIGQLRFLGLFIDGFLPLQALLIRKIKVYRNVQFKVNLDVLLRPERASVAKIRQELRDRGYSDDVMNPSREYFASLHLPAHGPHAQLSNMPDEVGHLSKDGTFTVRGEWIEALVDKNDPRPRSSTVVLYFHGGAHAFLSPASHREFLCRFAKEIGPGTRVFSVDYRMAPEHPFPAEIHDAFAAYLYLTEPSHEALILDERKSRRGFVPVDPRNIVVGGDSAGGALAASFILYMAKYVQPSMSPKYVLPHATILLSHTGTHDRLMDDSRLFAHRLGLANPEKLVRIELYQDMVHVHHVFSHLESSRVALRNIARFIERSRRARDVEEGLISVEESERKDRILYKNMAQTKSADNVEWVMVDGKGKEESKDDGWPMNVLLRVWPPNDERGF
ncbi:hypothetical protein BGX31_000303 [Mortierella sp. GBA43]|nr:hypothetical protein BGX31_000303 [Mortierella sp. GBA43]